VAAVAAAAIVLALVAVLLHEPEPRPLATSVAVKPTPGRLEAPSGETMDIAQRRLPPVLPEPTSPPAIRTPDSRERPDVTDRSRPVATKVEPPAPRPAEPTREPHSADVRSGGETGDPRDGAASMGEARALISTVEAGTDRLAQSFREYLKALGDWRPSGSNEVLWNEIKTLERTTDRLSLYIRKHQGLSKFRRKKHPSGWTLNEYGEVRNQIRDIAGRIPYVESAIVDAQTNSEVRDSWQELRSKIEYLADRIGTGN
jgi:hypothetical protein